jgi:hypothetical protein
MFVLGVHWGRTVADSTLIPSILGKTSCVPATCTLAQSAQRTYMFRTGRVYDKNAMDTVSLVMYSVAMHACVCWLSTFVFSHVSGITSSSSVVLYILFKPYAHAQVNSILVLLRDSQAGDAFQAHSRTRTYIRRMRVSNSITSAYMYVHMSSDIHTCTGIRIRIHNVHIAGGHSSIRI